MSLRFAPGFMSLRDRLRPQQRPPAPTREEEEARATQLLAAQRGRATIKSAPRAGKSATALIKPLLPQGGLGLSELKRRWPEIVGPSFHGKAEPEKFTAGVLTIRAPGAIAPFLQQQIPLLIERLKLAGATVKTIRIEQRALAPKPIGNVRKVSRALTAEEESALAQALDPIGDPALKSALLRLGRAVRRD